MSAVVRPVRQTLAAYDELPYDNLPLPQTHPARLHALGRLFGLDAPPIESCRVLELGCASGNNLIPMAAALPGARFVGIDLSARQIAEGCKLVTAAALRNIELRHADIATIGAGDGLFDYIVAHGVYSWVPPHVRDKVLSICSDNLAPNGVAYVSYNTQPGWGVGGMLRTMMMYHARETNGLTARVRKGRAMLDLLARAIPESPYGTLVREEIAFLAEQPDAYVSHDHLEGCNDPVYFHQFIEAASRHRLQYLAEAEFSVMGLGGVPQQTIAAMRSMAADIVAFEQLTDILRCRSFRQTLLVHDAAPVDRRLGSHSVLPFSIASPISVTPGDATRPPSENIVFVAPNGSLFGVGNAMTRAALLRLIERWPEAVPFADLHHAAHRALGATRGFAVGEELESRALFANEILQLYAAGIVHLRTWNPGVSAIPSERPAVARLARIQARRGNEIATLLHQSLSLGPIERALVPLLDGTRDIGALAETLAKSGSLSQPSIGVSAENATHAVLAALQRLGRRGVLAKAP